MDFFVFQAFIESVKRKVQTPIDVYDQVTMSVILPLSGKAIAKGDMPQPFPDFTKGKWKDRKSTFALNDDYQWGSVGYSLKDIKAIDWLWQF